MNADNERSDAMRRLSRFGTAAVSDTLTELGVPDHMVSGGITPVGPTHECAGIARTAQFGPDEAANGTSAHSRGSWTPHEAAMS